MQVAYYARQFGRDVARVLDRFRQVKGAGLLIYEVRVHPSVDLSGGVEKGARYCP